MINSNAVFKADNWKLALPAFLVFTLLLLSIASAAVPQYLNINGRLSNTTEFPQSGRFIFNFTLYNAPGGGTTIWTEIQNISVDRGRFNATLGLNTSLAGVNFNQQYWLGVKVGTDAEMVPRLRITSNPFVFRANITDFINGTVAGNLDMSSYSLFGAGWLNATNINASNWINATGLSIDLNTLFVDPVNDRVGIGTISPQFALDVRGSINSTAWVNSTAINIDAGTLFVDASNSRVGIGTISPSFALDVRGSINSTAWVNATNLYAGTFFANGTNVGIGTTSPNFTLDVRGDINATGNIHGTIGWTNLTAYPAACPAGQAITTLGDTITCAEAGGGTNISLNYVYNSTDWIGLRSTANGVVQLEVNSQISTDLSCTDCIGATEIEDVYLLNTGDTATGDYTFDTNTLFIDSSNDRVGIGTASPTQKLMVAGNVTPNANNTYALGNNTLRWMEIYGVSIYSGDIILENKFRITEAPDGIEFKNPHGEAIMTLDSRGNLWIKGEIRRDDNGE